MNLPEYENPVNVSKNQAYPGLDTEFTLSDRVKRAYLGQSYERQASDPIYRPLKIFTIDPSISRLEGSIAILQVPYEPVDVGPKGHVLEVEDYDESQHCRYSQIDLNDPAILMRSGRDPSQADWQFHQQMVYAVCSQVYASFRKALGRQIAWGFDRPRLRIRPHAGYDRNAYYQRDSGELCFGYYRADEASIGRNLPGGFVFTCLSHDIIAHEMTHALLDGLRAHFIIPSNPDVPAFHEGFADLVAIFHHFSHGEVVKNAIRQSKGDLSIAGLLTQLANQFGYTIGLQKPLRCAIDVTAPGESPRLYDPTAEPHELGSVLVSAVFEAFNTIFKRKTGRYIRLATNGSGVLPAGEIHPDLQDILAEEASQLASQFLTICIRAIDYCPPIALKFGEFLRAVITADQSVVPDDPWGYREAWIDAFRRRNIYPRGVANLSEDALSWDPPPPLPRIEPLSFAELKFRGDPGCPAGPAELIRQACALGGFITRPDRLKAFGLTHPDDPALGADRVDLPRVQSIRASRRSGPDGQVVFDLIAEVTQRRTVCQSDGQPLFDFYGGATVILDPSGDIRYIISKRVTQVDRLNDQQQFITQTNRSLWTSQKGYYAPQKQLFKLLHQP